jgi:hypothetical protein
VREGDGEGDAEGEGDGDGDGDREGDGEGFADFEGDAAAVEGGRDAGSRVVNAADEGDEGCFFLSFFSFGDPDPDAEDEGGCSVTRCTAAAGVPGGPGLCRLVTARAVPPAARASTIAAPAIARRCRRCDSCLRCLRCLRWLRCQRCRRCRDSPAAAAS